MNLCTRRGSSAAVTIGILFVIISITLAEPQITMSRQWIRGQYPSDTDDNRGDTHQRGVKSVFPKRALTRYLRPTASGNSALRLNSQFIDRLLKKIKEPVLAFTLVSTADATPGHRGNSREDSPFQIYHYAADDESLAVEMGEDLMLK